MAQKGIKIPYTSKVLSSTSKHAVNKAVLAAAEASPALRKEISRIFQVANRRIQNIEKKGFYSPAVAALNRPNEKYSKFSVGGKSWVELKKEYSKAITFLEKATSTASGTEQYARHLMAEHKYTRDDYVLMSKKLNNKLLTLSESEYVERVLMNYKDMTMILKEEVDSMAAQMESEAVRTEKAIDREIDRRVSAITNSKRAGEAEAALADASLIPTTRDGIDDLFKNFKM